MIRNENEYRIAAKRLQALESKIAERQANLTILGNTPAEIEEAMRTELSLKASITKDICEYERCKHDPDFPELTNFEGIGDLLIRLRLAAKLTQKQFAGLINRHITQVSKDEAANYKGISTTRIKRILDALKVELKTTVVSINGEPVQPTKEQTADE